MLILGAAPASEYLDSLPGSPSSYRVWIRSKLPTNSVPTGLPWEHRIGLGILPLGSLNTGSAQSL